VEARALTRSRALYAAGLLVALLAVLLGAWFFSGWHEVRMRQVEVRGTPHVLATTRATELGRELHDELEGLLATEVRRPYFHYQNLMHDPRSSAGLNVTPSPLAGGPEDKLVLGYFQIDAKGRATTPTVNDEVPELSEPSKLAANRAFRDQVVRDLAVDLVMNPTLVATNGPTPTVASNQPPNVQQQVAQRNISQQTFDASSYTQNSNASAVYWQQLDNNNNVTPRVRVPEPPPTAGQVTVTVSPLEWRTLRFNSVPTLVAVRQVQTPDGTLAQGFVIDRSTLTSWLAGKAGEMVAELRVKPDATLRAADAHAVDIAPGWELTVGPNPRTIARAAGEAVSVARTFLIRFVLIGLIAATAAAAVLLLVMRAETLARERSQFAASAAHELRTPLAGLQLYGDMLADGLGDPGKLRDYARRMSEEAARLGRVVSNVLGFSQLERGNLAVDAQDGPLGEALCELAERAQPALDRAGVVLDLDVERDLRARFDRDALVRIVGNLLDNAEKYSRTAEDRTIRLAARKLETTVEVTVTDHGTGIADASKLFKPFARGVPADGPAGLGLGLALSQSLAHAMGGSLSYRPADGGGAELVLSLAAG